MKTNSLELPNRQIRSCQNLCSWNRHCRSVLRPTRAKMSLLVNSLCQRRPRNPCDWWWWLQYVGIRNILPKTQSFQSPSSDGRYAFHVQHARWYKTLSINNNMGNVAIHSGPQVDWPQSSLAWNTWSRQRVDLVLSKCWKRVVFVQLHLLTRYILHKSLMMQDTRNARVTNKNGLVEFLDENQVVE